MQLQPHFLFNTLNAIATLMHRDVEAADRMLVRLSQLLRMSLEMLGQQEVSLRRELELLTPYVEIELTRFEDRLKVDVQVPDALLEARVPSLMLQPLVENAIKHGISVRGSGGRVEVTARREGGQLVLRVRDDGPGMPEGRTTPVREGVGLNNTRERLARLYAAEHRFHAGNAGGGGFEVEITLPFRTSKVREQADAA
jgi:two-component system, LytTR family, sensor kinase